MDEFSPEDRLKEIWRQGREFGLVDSEIYHVLTTAVQESGPKDPPQVAKETIVDYGGYSLSKLFRVAKVAIKFVLCFVVLLAVFGIVISMHNRTRKFVTRNIQDYIYPVMTRLRRVSMPLLSIYPSMSSWYSEECLLENPFFDQVNVDCSICSEDTQPEIVSDIKNFTEVYYNNGKIVIINHIAEKVSWTELISKIDISKEKHLGAWKVDGKFLHDDASFKEQLSNGIFPWGDLHVEWKINRLETLHILREMLPRFYFIPHDTEISLHHQVFIDGSEHEPYPIPISEFANVVLVQGEGSSVFTLDPSPHCEHDCQSVTLKLNASQILFFNWIFWRPTRVKGNGVSTLILSSFY